MKLSLFFLLVSMVPLSAHAYSYLNSFGSLLEVGAQLEQIPELQGKDKFELDEGGKKSMRDLEKFAKESPEGFASAYAEPASPTPPAQDHYDEPMDSCEGYDNPPPFWRPAPKPSPTQPGPAKPRSGRTAGNCAPEKGALQAGCCLMYVRLSLGIPSGMLGRHAQGAGPGLARAGYCEVKQKYQSAEAAPVGAVLLYSGGESGHAERKTGPNSYYFGPTNNSPASTWQNTKRRLQNIFVKCPG